VALTGNGTPDVYKILGGTRTHQAGNDINANQEDLYVGHSGDPWNASSARSYTKNIYIHVSSNNATTNNTKIQSA